MYSYSYQTDVPVWEQLGLDIDGETAGDNSGWSVCFSADGSRLAIGAPLSDGTEFSQVKFACTNGMVRVGYNWG